ncbi:MAG: bifunctional diaminohydroxyphosphoribosylaminopyrimidine deaminase/5-amino-6-(5-phosphoribosylamino)uracil reductase RibD [Cyclobacteriaceae bacterium]
MSDQNRFMLRALELAELGAGSVSPNPMVGCVIVKNNQIIGEGYHQNFGGPHAEVNAVNSVLDQAQIRGSKVYVSLEPCAHFGKTPPCADLLVQKGVKEVVICNDDPNPLVNGGGIKKLRDAGISVTRAVMKEEGAWLNRRFFTSMELQRPYIILKWAETKDGFVAEKNFNSKWISNEQSRKLVHKWRVEEDAILVGRITAHFDNPKLTVRDWPGKKNPIRVVIDRHLKLSPDLNLFADKYPTLCYNLIRSEKVAEAQYIQLDSNSFLKELLSDLNSRNIQSVIIEGGAATLNAFIDKGLWDEARVFTGEKRFTEGIAAPKIGGKLISQTKINHDTLSVFVNTQEHG